MPQDGDTAPRYQCHCVHAGRLLNFPHLGVRAPPAVLEAQQLLSQLDEHAGGNSLSLVMEANLQWIPGLVN